MSLKRQPRRTTRRGASAVEFAIVAPLLFLFVFGMIEIGRVVMVQQVLTNASREGARLAVMPNVTETAVESRVESFAAQGGVPSVSAEVTPDPASAISGDILTVAVSVPVESIGWMPVRLFFQTGSLTASTAMRKEGLE